MKTVYFKTDHYVRREGNVIDFTEYRDRAARAGVSAPAAGGDDVSFHWETDESVWTGEPEPSPAKRSAQPSHRRMRRTWSLADILEACAAGATLALVVTVWVQFMLL